MVAPADNMLEPVDELPLDEELIEMLPTVMEDPENEAKEQRALLEESVEEVVESEKRIQSASAENQSQELQNEELCDSNTVNVEHVKITTELQQVADTQDGVTRDESR